MLPSHSNKSHACVNALFCACHRVRACQYKTRLFTECASRGTCFDCTLLGVQVTAGLGLFYVQVNYFVNIVTPCSTDFGLLAGPWWDSEMEKDLIKSLQKISCNLCLPDHCKILTFCKKSFSFSARWARYLQNLVQDLAKNTCKTCIYVSWKMVFTEFFLVHNCQYRKCYEYGEHCILKHKR